MILMQESMATPERKLLWKKVNVCARLAEEIRLLGEDAKSELRVLTLEGQCQVQELSQQNKVLGLHQTCTTTLRTNAKL